MMSRMRLLLSFKLLVGVNGLFAMEFLLWIFVSMCYLNPWMDIPEVAWLLLAQIRNLTLYERNGLDILLTRIPGR